MLTLTADGPITAPGVYSMDEATYHGDPVPEWSLSASGATKLLRPSCPALYLYDRDHGSKATKAMDRGTLAHSVVLGVGAQPVLIPDELLSADGGIRSGEAKRFRDDAEAAGNIVVKSHEWAEIQAMADALRRHPVAGQLFQRDGAAEQSMFWRDEATGIMRRARLDWLPDGANARGRLIVADYKTARSADPGKWVKSAVDYGYHRQDANYKAGVKALGLVRDVAFVFVIQEPVAPYLVSVVEMDPEAAALGAAQMDHASRIFAQCLSTGHWPDYTDGRVVSVSLPTYYLINAEQELEAA